MNWLSELACPICHGPLEVPRRESGVTVLECGPCGQVHPYINGVVYMIPPEVYGDVNYREEIARYNGIAIKGPPNYHGLDETRPITRVALLREFLCKNGVEKFVDIGSGFGQLEEATLDLEVFAVDMSINFLQCILHWCPSVHCINAVAEMLPFPGQSIGCIVCDGTFQSVVDRKKLLKEINRITTPGAILVLTIAYQWHYPRKDQDGFNILIPKEKANLIKALEGLSFDVDFTYLDVSTASWTRSMDRGSYFWIIGRKKH